LRVYVFVCIVHTHNGPVYTEAQTYGILWVLIYDLQILRKNGKPYTTLQTSLTLIDSNFTDRGDLEYWLQSQETYYRRKAKCCFMETSVEYNNIFNQVNSYWPCYWAKGSYIGTKPFTWKLTE
jgi:hypothetical protein